MTLESHVEENNNGVINGSQNDGRPNLNVDFILAQIVKPCGLWQWSTVILIALSCSSPMTFPVFANSAGRHRCKLPERVESYLQRNNVSFHQAMQLISPKNGVDSGCEMLSLNWTAIDLESLRNGTISITETYMMEPCREGYVFEQDDAHYPGSVIAEFHTVCDSSWMVPFGTSIYMCGSLIGNLLGGWFGGKLGRRASLMLFALVQLVGDSWTCLAKSPYSYFLARGLVGLGATAKQNIAGVLIMELTLSTYRSMFRATLALFLGFFYRAMLAVWAYFIPYWRWLNLAVMSPNFLSVLYLFLLPESPRWLFSRGRYQQALQVLGRGHRINHWRRSHTKSEALLALEAYAKQLEGSEAATKERHMIISLRELARDKKLLNTAILFILVMFCMNLSLTGLLFYARLIKHSVYVVGLLNATMAFPGILVFALLYRYARERKWPLLTLVTLHSGILLFTATYIVLAQPDSDLVLNLCCNITLCLLQAAVNMTVLYIPELLPSVIRTEGLGVILGVAKVGGILSSFVNALDQYWFHGMPIFIYLSLSVLTMIALACTEDTNGENMPDN